jgi:hypothetical protein
MRELVINGAEPVNNAVAQASQNMQSFGAVANNTSE